MLDGFRAALVVPVAAAILGAAITAGGLVQRGPGRQLLAQCASRC